MKTAPKSRILMLQIRGGFRAAATSKMECFVIIVNGFQPLTIITKHSILDVAAALDPPLQMTLAKLNFFSVLIEKIVTFTYLYISPKFVCLVL